MVDLKPCPFCGGLNCFIRDRGEHAPGVVYVMCSSCDAEGPPVGWGYVGGWLTREIARAKAVEFWNTRAPYVESHSDFTVRWNRELDVWEVKQTTPLT